MKNFQFKNNKSFIRVVQEPKLKKKKWSFDRLTYIAVIVAIAFTALKFTYRSANVMNGNGQIVFQKLVVNFTDDIRFQEILIEEGDSIKAGDTLFIYKVEDDVDNHSVVVQQAETQGQFNSKILDIKREILLKEAKLKGTKALLQQQKLLKEQTVKMVLLEVEDRSALDAIAIEQTKLRSQIAILEAEIEQLKKLVGQYRSIGRNLVAAYTPTEEILPFVAPVDGYSGTVNFENKEVCYREQEVLTIHDPEVVEIRAYFNQKYMDYLTEGQTIKVTFPDGTISKGRISQTFISTNEVPKEFQKKYEPTERNIVVSIEPVNKDEEDIWRKFYLMEVELTIFKYGIGF